jgi:hypothetical protein
MPAMQNGYAYFVSYNYSTDTGLVFGNTEVTLPGPIHTMANVSEVETLLRRHFHAGNVVILGYQQLTRPIRP